MSPRVEAIEASEFAIAFASYIEGDKGLLIILVVMAVISQYRWHPLPGRRPVTCDPLPLRVC